MSRLRNDLAAAIGLLGFAACVFPSGEALAQASQNNLAWKAKVTGSRGVQDLWGMNDGNYGSKADIPDKGWFAVDFGASVSVGRVFWIFRGPAFTLGKMSSSDDGVTWTKFWEDCGPLSLRKGCGVGYHGTELFLPTVTTRHIKFEMSGSGEFPTTSFYEFEVYAPDSSSGNLALGKTGFIGGPSGKPTTEATDGSDGTGAWLKDVPQVMVVDLGSPTLINRIRTTSVGNNPGARNFSYFASDDNKTWTKLFDHMAVVTSDAFTSSVFNRVTTRYIKGEYRDKPTAGYKILEIMVYGPGTSTVDLPYLPRNEPRSSNDGGAPVNASNPVDASASGADASNPIHDAAASPSSPSPSMPLPPASPSAGGPVPSTSPDGGAGNDETMPPTVTSSSGCQLAPGGGGTPFGVVSLVGLAWALLSRVSRSRRQGKN